MPKLAGLDEPLGSISNSLRMGTFVFINIEGTNRSKKMMISAFLRNEKQRSDSIYVLLTPHCYTSEIESGLKCSVKKGTRKWNLGRIVDPTEIFSSPLNQCEGSPDQTFIVVELDETPLFKHHASNAKILSTVLSFREALWSGCFRVRRLNNDEYIHDLRKAGKGQPRWKNARGRAIAVIHNVEVEDGNSTKVYDYCGVIAAKRGRSVGTVQDVGAPIISRNGALAGIIVGQESSETLMLPVEMIAKKAEFQFVTLGGDWPKVLVKT